jgi:hypothetical protein
MTYKKKDLIEIQNSGDYGFKEMLESLTNLKRKRDRTDIYQFASHCRKTNSKTIDPKRRINVTKFFNQLQDLTYGTLTENKFVWNEKALETLGLLMKGEYQEHSIERLDKEKIRDAKRLRLHLSAIQSGNVYSLANFLDECSRHTKIQWKSDFRNRNGETRLIGIVLPEKIESVDAAKEIVQILRELVNKAEEEMKNTFN